MKIKAGVFISIFIFFAFTPTNSRFVALVNAGNLQDRPAVEAFTKIFPGSR